MINVTEKDFEKFYKTKYSYFKRLMFVKLGCTNEDVLQDSFIKLYEKRANFDPNKSQLTTYFFRIVINTFLRDKITREKLPTNDLQEFNDLNIYDEVEDDEYEFNVNKLVYGLMNHLTELDREIVKDFYQNEMSYMKIAEKHNVNLGYVKNHLRTSKRTMNHHLKKMKLL